MDLEEKLEKFTEIINQQCEVSEILKQIEHDYVLSTGMIFTAKMFADFDMWKSFEYDYGIDKIGIRRFREILGDPDKFKKENKI